jgi:hypothetical protein
LLFCFPPSVPFFPATARFLPAQGPSSTIVDRFPSETFSIFSSDLVVLNSFPFLLRRKEFLHPTGFLVTSFFVSSERSRIRFFTFPKAKSHPQGKPKISNDPQSPANR